MRIVSWNILDGGGRRVPGIAEAVLREEPDVVVLGEFKANRSGKELLWLLERGGLTHSATASIEPQRKSVAVVSRSPMTPEPFPEWPVDHSHRLVAGQIQGIRILGTYFPATAPFIAQMFEPLHKATPRLNGVPTVLLGDLNAGSNPADTQGAVLTGGAAFDAMAEMGWRDLWREVNGDRPGFTWYSRGAKNGFRLDHALSLGIRVEVTECRYEHTVREKKLSDHSMVVVDCQVSVGRAME